MEQEPAHKKICQELVNVEPVNTDPEHVADEDSVAENSELAIEGNNCEETKKKRPPRSERKRQRAEQIKLNYKLQRKQKKMERKQRMREQRENNDDDGIRSEKLNQQDVRERLREAQKDGQIICVDCSLEQLMSVKEKGKLASQICRMYGTNRRTDKPAHLYLTGLQHGGVLYEELKKKMTGFDTESCVLDHSDKPHAELFTRDRIVYLTPDSCNPLTDIDPQKVYVMGGLVDENIQKNVTHSRAEQCDISTARLPIDKHMEKVDSGGNKILAICQVFEILMKYKETSDWKQALAAGMPKRKGYTVKTEQSS